MFFSFRFFIWLCMGISSNGDLECCLFNLVTDFFHTHFFSFISFIFPHGSRVSGFFSFFFGLHDILFRHVPSYVWVWLAGSFLGLFETSCCAFILGAGGFLSDLFTSILLHFIAHIVDRRIFFEIQYLIAS